LLIIDRLCRAVIAETLVLMEVMMVSRDAENEQGGQSGSAGLAERRHARGASIAATSLWVHHAQGWLPSA
ncbi:MAG: hypothetical protein ABJD38_16830, partial [Aurantimonas coralicida]